MFQRITVALFTLVITTSVSQLTRGPRNNSVILSISDEQKTQYLNQNFEPDTYKYGYNINSYEQFHHEVYGPDGVTYGCYGYVDPFNQLKTTFYLSDGWGYRVVQPGKSVELFLHKHEHYTYTDEHDHHEHHEHHGMVTPWMQLYFPAVCGQYVNANVRPPVMPSSVSRNISKILSYQGRSGILNAPENIDIYRTSSSSRIFGNAEKPRGPLISSYLKTREHLGIPRTSDITRISGSSTYPERSKTSNTTRIPGFLRIPNQLQTSFSHHPRISGIASDFLGASQSYSRRPVISDTLKTFGLSETPNTSKKSGSFSYSGRTRIPSTDISGSIELPSYLGHLDLQDKIKILGKPEKPRLTFHSEYLNNLDKSRAPNTVPGTRRESLSLERQGTFGISVIPDISRLSFRQRYPSTSGTLSVFNARDKSGPSYYRHPTIPEKYDYQDFSSYSVYPKAPAGSEGPIGGIGGIGNIGDVGGEGGVGSNGPNGPWPTGSPGPDGPWPGDLDYTFEVKPTRRPSHKVSAKKQQSATYPFDLDNYNTIAQYNSRNYFSNSL